MPERVDVGHSPDELFFEELVDERIPQSLDVHGPAGGEMEERFPELGRAGRVGAARDDLLFGPESGRPADGTMVREDELFLFPRAPLLHHRHNLGDDVTAPFDEHPVADPDVLAFDLVFVVEGRPGDRRAGQAHGLEIGHRRQGSGPSDLDPDVQNFGRRLTGRELE